MTRKDLKVYNQTKKEIEELNNTIEQLDKDIDNYYDENLYELRKTSTLKRLENQLIESTKKRAFLRAYLRMLTLPKKVVIVDGLEDAKTFIKDYDTSAKIDYVIEEMVYMFLTDNYNDKICNYTWAKNDKDNNIYITRIRWDKNQLIKEDIKDILKGKIKSFSNGLVVIKRHNDFKDHLSILNKTNGFLYMASYKVALNYLKDIKAL